MSVLQTSLIYRDITDITTGFCGNTINGNSAPAPDADCSMTCAGDPFSYCGAGNRLELYILETASTSTTGAPPVEG